MFESIQMYTVYPQYQFTPSNKIESFNNGTPHSSHPLPTFHSIRKKTFEAHICSNCWRRASAICCGENQLCGPHFSEIQVCRFCYRSLKVLEEENKNKKDNSKKNLCCHDETRMQRPKDERNICIHVSFKTTQSCMYVYVNDSCILTAAWQQFFLDEQDVRAKDSGNGTGFHPVIKMQRTLGI